jgi:hypothetical protein
MLENEHTRFQNNKWRPVYFMSLYVRRAMEATSRIMCTGNCLNTTAQANLQHRNSGLRVKLPTESITILEPISFPNRLSWLRWHMSENEDLSKIQSHISLGQWNKGGYCKFTHSTTVLKKKHMHNFDGVAYGITTIWKTRKEVRGGYINFRAVTWMQLTQEYM